MRTAHRLAQDSFSRVPLAEQPTRGFKVFFVYLEADAGDRPGHEPKPFVFRFVADLGMDARLFEFLFDRFSLGWLVERSNGNHVHKPILHVSPAKSITRRRGPGHISTLPPMQAPAGGAPVSDPAVPAQERAMLPDRRPALRWHCQEAPRSPVASGFALTARRHLPSYSPIPVQT